MFGPLMQGEGEMRPCVQYIGKMRLKVHLADAFYPYVTGGFTWWALQWKHSCKLAIHTARPIEQHLPDTRNFLCWNDMIQGALDLLTECGDHK